MTTIVDVAREANVSPATVSCVLNGRPSTIGVGRETRQRVLNAVARLNYRGNEIARSMIRGRQAVVGLVVPTAGYQVVGEILEGVLDVAERVNYLVKLLRADHETGVETARLARQHCLAGLICSQMPDGFVADAHRELAAGSTPMVVADNSSPAPWKLRVLSDDRDGIRQAVSYLAELGHRSIGCLISDAHTAWAVARRKGFSEAIAGIRAAGGHPQLFQGMDVHSDFGAVLSSFGRKRPRYSAVLCENDYLAMSFIRAARRAGWQVPRDISVIGFADLAGSECCDPPLTTVRQPFRAMGARAMTRLMALIEPGAAASGGKAADMLPTQLVIRESTGPVPAVPVRRRPAARERERGRRRPAGAAKNRTPGGGESLP